MRTYLLQLRLYNVPGAVHLCKYVLVVEESNKKVEIQDSGGIRHSLCSAFSKTTHYKYPNAVGEHNRRITHKQLIVRTFCLLRAPSEKATNTIYNKCDLTGNETAVSRLQSRHSNCRFCVKTIVPNPSNKTFSGKPGNMQQLRRECVPVSQVSQYQL